MLQLSLVGLAATFATNLCHARQDEISSTNRSDLSSQSSPGAGSGTNVLSRPRAAAGSIQTAATNAAGTAATPLMASHLIGSKVKTASGENVGQIDDVLIDQTGQIRLAILGVGGFLGIGEKKTPVPWQAITATANQDFTLNVDRQKLKNAPTIDKNQTAGEWATPSFMTEVYAHYGIQAPGSVGGTGTGTLGTDTGRQLRNDASDLKDDLKQKGKDLQNDAKQGSNSLKNQLDTK
jgi:sporulation protein YlmC with PRC-barrel domain